MNHGQDFAMLLQGGVQVEVELGCTVLQFLSEQMKIPADYIEKRILSLLMDGRPVHDYKKGIVHEGAVLALSAVMPGHLGAMMHQEKARIERDAGGKQESLEENRFGLVTVKLFNFTGRELADTFLNRGVYVEAERFHHFLSMMGTPFFSEILSIHLDDKAIPEPHDMAELVPKQGTLHLFVEKPDAAI
jgi:hypothetical protein